MSFIVCEGLDCAGKTTSIRRTLEYLLDFIYSKGLKTDTPAGRISELCPETATLLAELLYLDRTFVRPNLERGKDIIQDRWYYSVLSHNQENTTDKSLEDVVVPFLSQPDLLIYFTVSLKERLERLKKTGEEHHRELLENPGLIEQREKRYFKYYSNFKGDKAIIDTTNLSEEESARRLVNIIQSWGL